MVGVGEWVIKTRTAAFVGCGVGGARDLYVKIFTPKNSRLSNDGCITRLPVLCRPLPPGVRAKCSLLLDVENGWEVARH